MLGTDSLNQLSEVFTERLTEIQERMLRGLEVASEPLDSQSDSTPKDEILAVDRWKLYRYRPIVKNTKPIPVLIFYALINRYYMIDLQPDRSMVKKFLEAGLDVFVVDWGHPSRGDRFLTMEDYIDGYMNTAVDHIRKLTGQKAITIYGICQGGTLSSIYTACYPEKVKNLAIMVAPINFHTDTGLLNVWAHSLDTEKMVDTFGNVPGDFMNVGFLLLNPLRLMFQKYIDLLEHIDNKDFVSNFVRMEKWIFDSPDQSGEAFKQFVKCMYQENQLVRGEFKLGDKTVDLQTITQPVLNVFAEKDHLVPPACSRPFTDLVGSEDKTILSFPTGHIGLFTSSKSQGDYAPRIAKWLADHSDLSTPPKTLKTKPSAHTTTKPARSKKPVKKQTVSKVRGGKK